MDQMDPVESMAPAESRAMKESGQQFLDDDQKMVTQRISQAIALLVYGEQTNRPIIEMAQQGEDGIIMAVKFVMDKITRSANPGVPRDLLPLAAFAALTLILSFLEEIDRMPEELDMRQFLPKLIAELADQYQATPIERAQLTRLARKNERGMARGDADGVQVEEGPAGVVAQTMEA